MGRAVVKVADALIGVVLKDGMNAVLIEKPLHDVRVIDSRYKGWCVELLLESPDLKGPEDATLDTAPNYNVQMIRKTVLEGDVAVQLIADHMRNADNHCECGKLGTKDIYLCPACRSQWTLEVVPHPLLEQARAARRVAGELVEAPSDEPNGETPGV